MSGFRIGDFRGKIDPAILNKDPAGPRADDPTFRIALKSVKLKTVE